MQPQPALVHEDEIADVADDDRRNARKDFGEETRDRRDTRRRELREGDARENADASGQDEDTAAERQRAENRVLRPSCVPDVNSVGSVGFSTGSAWARMLKMMSSPGATISSSAVPQSVQKMPAWM